LDPNAWLEQFLRDLVATNPKSGADAEQVIQSKTKDKVLLLDSASAQFSVDDVRAAEAKRRALGGGTGGGGTRRRLSATQKKRRGFHAIPEESRRWEVFAPLHALWRGYAAGLLEGGGGGGGGGGGSGGGGGGGVAGSSGGGRGGAPAAAAAWAEAERRLRGADLHGAEVRVDACSCPSRVGAAGIVVRDTALTLQLITAGDALHVVPKKGAVFSFEAPGPWSRRVTVRGDLMLGAQNGLKGTAAAGGGAR
jgi:ribonuclease P protein subunit POP4